MTKLRDEEPRLNNQNTYLLAAIHNLLLVGSTEILLNGTGCGGLLAHKNHECSELCIEKCRMVAANNEIMSLVVEGNQGLLDRLPHSAT